MLSRNDASRDIDVPAFAGHHCIKALASSMRKPPASYYARRGYTASA